MRGFAGGVVVGLALGAVGLAVLSVAVERETGTADVSGRPADGEPPAFWPGMSPEEQAAREAAAAAPTEPAAAEPLPEEAAAQDPQDAAAPGTVPEGDEAGATGGAAPLPEEELAADELPAGLTSPEPDLLGGGAAEAPEIEPASLSAATTEGPREEEPAAAAPVAEPVDAAPAEGGLASPIEATAPEPADEAPAPPLADDEADGPEAGAASAAPENEAAPTADSPAAATPEEPPETPAEAAPEVPQPGPEIGSEAVTAPGAPAGSEGFDIPESPSLALAPAGMASPLGPPGAEADVVPPPVLPEPQVGARMGAEVATAPAVPETLLPPEGAPEAPLFAEAVPELAGTVPEGPAAPQDLAGPEVVPAAEASSLQPEPVAGLPEALPAPGPMAAPSGAPGAPDGEPLVAGLLPAPVTPPTVSPDQAPAGAVSASAEPTEPELPGVLSLDGGALPGEGSVPVNRLTLQAEPEPEPEPAPEPEPLPEDAPAFLRFAADWEAPDEARPLLAMILLDEGEASPELAASLPMPVAVAVDPNLPDAAERASAYRAAGLEVVALARLPRRAQPTDVEVFLRPTLERMPEAVAVLDLGEGGLRGRDATAEMALSRLAQAGLGAVVAAGGLGRGAEGVEAAGVPAAELLRDLDGDGQDGLAIRRHLDDAARRAGQDGGAVVLARLRPATLEALAAWTGDRRAAEVTLAPLSAVLARDAGVLPATP